MADRSLRLDELEQVFVGYPHAEQTAGWFSASLARTMWKWGDLVGEFFPLRAGPLIELARDVIVRRFMDSPFDWLVWLDADMCWHPNQFLALVETAQEDRLPIVSAFYNRLVGDDRQIVPVPMADDVPVEAGQGMREVSSVGLGFCVTHRSVFEKIEWPHFETVWRDGALIGEDVSFCEKARVAGLEVWCATGIEVGHVKSVII